MLNGKNPFKPIAVVVATKVCKHLIDIINTSLEPFAVYWFEIQCHPLSNMTTPYEHTSYWQPPCKPTYWQPPCNQDTDNPHATSLLTTPMQTSILKLVDGALSCIIVFRLVQIQFQTTHKYSIGTSLQLTSYRTISEHVGEERGIIHWAKVATVM